MADKKEFERLVRDAQKWPGWRVKEIKKGWLLFPPDKTIKPVLVHKTNSDWRAMANALAELKRKKAPL